MSDIARELVLKYNESPPSDRETALFRIYLHLLHHNLILGPNLAGIAWYAYIGSYPDRFIGALKIRTARECCHVIARQRDFVWDLTYIIENFGEDRYRKPSEELLCRLSDKMYNT
jgi:hypothetical protein